jgi:hypothetical protein
MKLTRRQLVIAAAGSGVAVRALAQSGTAATGPDPGKQARDTVQRNADALAIVSIPMSLEPAFQFKA